MLYLCWIGAIGCAIPGEIIKGAGTRLAIRRGKSGTQGPRERDVLYCAIFSPPPGPHSSEGGIVRRKAGNFVYACTDHDGRDYGTGSTSSTAPLAPALRVTAPLSLGHSLARPLHVLSLPCNLSYLSRLTPAPPPCYYRACRGAYGASLVVPWSSLPL